MTTTPKPCTMPDTAMKVTEWLMGDDTGLSSETLAREFLGLSHDGRKFFRGINHPHDPDDIGRCFRLIEIIPEVKSAVFSLAKKDEYWKKLAEKWDDIHASMDAEVGIHWEKGHSAPKTYEMMEGILYAKL